MKDALAFFATVAASIALVLLAAPALAQSIAAGGDPGAAVLKPEQLIAHAAAIAACINAIVLFLKSPLAGFVWGKVPPAARVLVLALLAGIAVAAESIGMGKPPVEAILVAVAGLFTAIGAREVVVAVKKKPGAR